MEFKDKSEALFQLWRGYDEEDGTVSFSITSDFEGVSKLGGGCYWCVEFENLSSAVKAIGEIVENAEKNGDSQNAYGKVDIDWLLGKYGKGTC